MKSVKASSTADWGTPREVVDLARAILGRIDVDPFSSGKWNAIIGAERFGSLPGQGGSFDGYIGPWGDAWPRACAVDSATTLDVFERGELPATAFVNPPGDASGSNVSRAWRILTRYYELGYLSGGAFWIGFSLSQLATLQDNGAPFSPLASIALKCVPRKRLCYQRAPGVPVKQPDRPSYLVLLPALDNTEGARQLTAWQVLAGRMGQTF